MEIRFLGAANTVTGSQFLLITDEPACSIDCGMFQGSPHEVVRNHVPLAYDPATLDAIVLTHAHLDHCGLIPHVVAEGFKGPIYATRGTIELAALVLLDSGKLQEEYAKRQRHWAAKHPDKAAAEDQRDQAEIEAQEQIAEQAGRGCVRSTPRPAHRSGSHAGDLTPDGHVVASGVDELALHDEQGSARAWAIRRSATPTTTRPWPATRPSRTWSSRSRSTTRPRPRPRWPISEPRLRAAARRSRRASRPSYHDAGHILGSSIVGLHVEARGRPGPDARLLRRPGPDRRPDPARPDRRLEADYVFVESTYGGRAHEPEAESLTQLAEAVNDSIAEQRRAAHPVVRDRPNPGDRLGAEPAPRRRPDPEGQAVPRLADGVEGSDDLPRAHATTTTPRRWRCSSKGEGPIDFPNAQETTLAAQSEAIERARRPYMLVASNGMLTGGRVLGHLRTLIGDPKAMILFVGYQGEGTLGAHLQAGAKTARIDGQEYQVRCEVRSISGFSAHADEPGILAWLGDFIEGRKAGDPGVPRRVFIVHGDPEAQAGARAEGRGARPADDGPALARARGARLDRRARGTMPHAASPAVAIRPIRADERDELDRVARDTGARRILASRGSLHRGLGAGVPARGRRRAAAGRGAYRLAGGECELVLLEAFERGAGVGTGLLGAVSSWPGSRTAGASGSSLPMATSTPCASTSAEGCASCMCGRRRDHSAGEPQAGDTAHRRLRHTDPRRAGARAGPLGPAAWSRDPAGHRGDSVKRWLDRGFDPDQETPDKAPVEPVRVEPLEAASGRPRLCRPSSPCSSCSLWRRHVHPL